MIDFMNIDKYKENNRIEAKKHSAVSQTAFGKHIRLLPIRLAELFCLVSKN